MITMGVLKTKRWNDPSEPEDGTRILVARYRPRGLRKELETWKEWRKDLGPSKELHATWYGKDGRVKISFNEYAKRYHAEMVSQTEAITDLARRILAGETLTLLCYCADQTQCHRTLLKAMVNTTQLILH